MPMEEAVIKALKAIDLVPGAHVDRSFGQGYQAVFDQLSFRLEREADEGFVKSFIKECQKDVNEIELWVKPYNLPPDYLFFLQYCGGLIIKKEEFNLILDGIGPMVEEWYSFIMGDEVYKDPPNDGLIYIGCLPIKTKNEATNTYGMVTFFLDLGGIVKKNSVLGIGRGNKAISLEEIFANFSQYPDVAKILANSFTEFLELIAKTEGTLGYF
jgi:hypothetical protein